MKMYFLIFLVNYIFIQISFSIFNCYFSLTVVVVDEMNFVHPEVFKEYERLQRKMTETQQLYQPIITDVNVSPTNCPRQFWLTPKTPNLFHYQNYLLILTIRGHIYNIYNVRITSQGSHPTWKIWNFVIFFSKPGKCLEFAQKVVKTWTFNSKPWKNMTFANSMFQASLFKMSFTEINLIYFFLISTLSTQTLIWSQIDLGFHCF